MTNYSQKNFIGWALRSKVGGSNGSQDLGPLVLDKTLSPICMHVTIIWIGSWMHMS